MPKVSVSCESCGKEYVRGVFPTMRPKTFSCSVKCRTAYRHAKLTKLQQTLYKLIKDNEGISTYEIVKALGIDYTRARVNATKLWNLGLVGRLYNTWGADKDGGDPEEWKK